METNNNFLKDFPSVESMERAIASFKSDIESRNEGIEYRARNYYNCIDDYSSGGICDKAAYEAISSYRGSIETLENQIKEGKPFIREFDCNVLCDLSGNIVSERLVNGRYGSCWIIKDADGLATFVSTAKKQATYRKKGYKVMSRVYTVEYYFTTTHTFKHGLISRGRILSEKLIDSPETDLWVSDRLNSVAYFALHNNN